ncbi:MAG: orotate phosphoribosyltransferase [Nitrososphaerales archaeon]|nr:orotate phosphoribosyltransferase [Nitrososphaerales archaeon]
MSEHERVSASSLGRALFEMGALRFGSFTLPNGRRSPYDVDLRLVPSHPDIYTTVLAAYVELAESVGADKFDAIAGVATAGVTISSPLAVMLKKPMMYVRKRGEGRGHGRVVEGASKRGSRVLLIDDLVSSGASVAYSAGALRKEGYRVSDSVVLVDRLEGGEAKLASIGVKLNSFTTITDLLKALRELKLVKGSQVDAVLLRSGQSSGARKAHRK